MDILFRFWDEDNKVDIGYFDFSFFDGATATNIQEGFTSGIKEQDKNNFLQISSDGPNLNLLRNFHHLRTSELVDCIQSITV